MIQSMRGWGNEPLHQRVNQNSHDRRHHGGTGGTLLKLASSRSRKDSSSDDEDALFFQNLRQRANELSQQSQTLTNKWKKGDCKTSLALVLPDWVRRLDVDYPLVACGSAREAVYLGHLETGQVITNSGLAIDDDSNDDKLDDENSDSNQDILDVELRQTLRLILGNYDGGGTLSIALQGSLICEGGRSGGVRVWRIIGAESNRLISQGSIPAMKGLLATCMHLDKENGDRLWVGTHTGEVHAFRLDDPLKPLALQTQPQQTWRFGQNSGSCIMSLQFSSEFNCGVATLAGGSIHLFSTAPVANDAETSSQGEATTDATAIGVMSPPFDSTERRSANSYPTQACLIRTKQSPGNDDDDDDDSCGLAIVCGGSNGSMYYQNIALSDDNEIDAERPFREPMQSMGQGHLGGLIKGMVSPFVNTLVTLGQDGSMRVWDLQQRKPYYSFQGYKVWAGSLWTDGQRLVSDGVDNSILMHDFGQSEDEVA